jgi:protein arginine kinase activator
MHLCEDCAKDKSLQMEQQFGLADLLAGLSDFGKQIKTSEKTTVTCDNCGLSYDDFRKMGRLGCSRCYDSFKVPLSTLLKKIHGANKHLGKVPVKMSVQVQKAVDDIGLLQEKMQNAIESENFEEAAKLRDKIKEVEGKGKE